MSYMLIAEIGNNHLGSFNKAKEMVKQAKESGCTHVKSQVFDVGHISGSMPPSFYERCYLPVDKWFGLKLYAQEIGIEMFFSYFIDKEKQGNWDLLTKTTRIKKVSASQTERLFERGLEYEDTEDHIYSINKYTRLKRLEKSKIMYASDYMIEAKEFHPMVLMFKQYHRNIGYSYHSINMDNVLEAVTKHNCKTIEKHFVLDEDKENIKYKGELFRDSVHAATPKDFEELAKRMSNKWGE